MRGYDAFAGVIKSGGKTRRAAKMVILNTDHPDIAEFINCKAEEERKAWALIDAGYDGSFNVKGGAYDSVFFQNANHSVRVTDEFMRAVQEDREWQTRYVISGQPCESFRARDLMKMMAEAAWQCGDPGMQFDSTINGWHTCPNTARINASNPCSEYMFLDDTACNLASLNLMRFLAEDGEFDAEAFKAACRTLITAQEVLVDNASYPTPAIDRNSHDYRPLGLGYANLGVLLMDRGLPYDSDAGRAYAAAVTALMHGEAYAQSARVASSMAWFSPTSLQTNSKPSGICLAAASDQGLAGYLVCSRYADVWHLMNVAVTPDARRQGIATMLMRNLFDSAGSDARYTLEVRTSNEEAIAMYRHFGFRPAGRRRRYYHDNGEDALIMWLDSPAAVNA